MKKTTHTAAMPSESFTEITEGDAPCSVNMALNAKGRWQPEIKLYFATVEEAETQGPNALKRIADALALRFPLAGD